MSHVYQPLLIGTLLDAGGTATLRQAAIAFVSQDESVIREAEQTIVRMPVPVLRRHGVIDYDITAQVLKLKLPKLTVQQRAEIRMLCDQRLGEYLAKRGMSIWDYRLIDDTAVPRDVRYRVLASSEHRCALCGATAKERLLDVDHIIPRSRGGESAPDNLQVLCSRCNRAKGNRDTKDFRAQVPDRDPDCAFCNVGDRAISENGTVLAIEDLYPVAPGHMLVLPKRHAQDYFSMTEAERVATNELLRVLRNRIMKSDSDVAGFNVGWNCGAAAGQTVAHAHVHLIPRRVGDVKHPAGGVRGVIPGKQQPAT